MRWISSKSGPGASARAERYGRDADLQPRVRSKMQGELVLKNSHGHEQDRSGVELRLDSTSADVACRRQGLFGLSCVSVQPQPQDQQCPIIPTSAIVSAQLSSHGLPGLPRSRVQYCWSWICHHGCSSNNTTRLIHPFDWTLPTLIPTAWNPTCSRNKRFNASSVRLVFECA